MKVAHQNCNRCLMDTSAADFELDELGVCNYCSQFLARMNTPDQLTRNNSEELARIISRIKREGKAQDYDCLVGISGGVDSSYLLTRVVALGLRPLVVHMDNGWNSEIAQNNIARIIQTLGVDYISHVIYWPEYRSLMQSFFDADVIDVELLYDNAMLAVNYKLARKYKIKYIIAGTNNTTEGFRMPPNWSWLKYDKKNILAIHKLNPNKTTIDSFPIIGILELLFSKFVLRIKWLSMLDYMEYNKNEAIEELVKNFGFKPYPYKHYESVFTRFYQGFLLPEKFGIDKRKIHLSNLIMSDQLTRKSAEIIMETPTYPSEKDLRNDKVFFLKKMKWEESDLTDYLNRKPVSHSRYRNSSRYWKLISKYKNLIKKVVRK